MLKKYAKNFPRKSQIYLFVHQFLKQRRNCQENSQRNSLEELLEKMLGTCWDKFSQNVQTIDSNYEIIRIFPKLFPKKFPKKYLKTFVWAVFKVVTDKIPIEYFKAGSQELPKKISKALVETTRKKCQMFLRNAEEIPKKTFQVFFSKFLKKLQEDLSNNWPMYFQTILMKELSKKIQEACPKILLKEFQALSNWLVKVERTAG